MSRWRRVRGGWSMMGAGLARGAVSCAWAADDLAVWESDDRARSGSRSLPVAWLDPESQIRRVKSGRLQRGGERRTGRCHRRGAGGWCRSSWRRSRGSRVEFRATFGRTDAESIGSLEHEQDPNCRSLVFRVSWSGLGRSRRLQGLPGCTGVLPGCRSDVQSGPGREGSALVASIRGPGALMPGRQAGDPSADIRGRAPARSRIESAPPAGRQRRR